MAIFHRNDKGAGYFKITLAELVAYSENPAPVCDDCIKPLAQRDDVILIPILNGAYCPKCAPDVLASLDVYAEDKPIADRREAFYADFFGTSLEVT